MAVDPLIDRLPEHEGPASITWNLIMKTTMGSVVPQPPASGFNLSKTKKPKMTAGEDFIALEKENERNEEGKKKQSSKSPIKETCIPWKSCDKYPETPVG